MQIPGLQLRNRQGVDVAAGTSTHLHPHPQARAFLLSVARRASSRCFDWALGLELDLKKCSQNGCERKGRIISRLEYRREAQSLNSAQCWSWCRLAAGVWDPTAPEGLQQGQKERQGKTSSVKGVEVSYWVCLLGQNPARWNPEEKNKNGKGSDEQLHLMKSF